MPAIDKRCSWTCQKSPVIWHQPCAACNSSFHPNISMGILFPNWHLTSTTSAKTYLSVGCLTRKHHSFANQSNTNAFWPFIRGLMQAISFITTSQVFQMMTWLELWMMEATNQTRRKVWPVTYLKSFQDDTLLFVQNSALKPNLP